MKPKERPIIFSGEMVKAILAGRKTQTRRVAKDVPDWVKSASVSGRIAFLRDENGMNFRNCPYGGIGDRLWVKETWVDVEHGRLAAYKASTSEPFASQMSWKSPIFMPRWASRITLEVVSVRVERLQEIIEDDCCLEMGCATKWPGPGLEPYKRNLRGLFYELWDSINAKRGYSWDENPWVWVIEFMLEDCTQ